MNEYQVKKVSLRSGVVEFCPINAVQEAVSPCICQLKPRT